MRYKRPGRRVRAGAGRAVGGGGGGGGDRDGRTLPPASPLCCQSVHHERRRSGARRLAGAEHAGEAASFGAPTVTLS